MYSMMIAYSMFAGTIRGFNGNENNEFG